MERETEIYILIFGCVLGIIFCLKELIKANNGK